MFWKKKKIMNSTFGEIVYYGTGWRTVEKLSVSLFGKTFSVYVLARAKKDLNEAISDLQESALTSFEDLIASKKSQLEETITNYLNRVSSIYDYNCRYREGYNLGDIPSRFVPHLIEITRKGECAIYVGDDAEEYGEYDDWDEGFVVTIIPEIQIYSKELYVDYICGGGTL